MVYESKLIIRYLLKITKKSKVSTVCILVTWLIRLELIQGRFPFNKITGSNFQKVVPFSIAKTT